MKSSIIHSDMKYILDTNIDWAAFEGKSILITGANGILPSYMVKTLLYLNDYRLENKCRIIGLVRNISKAKEKFKEYIHRDELEFLVQDVCDEVHYDGDVDYIIHAASQASPKYYGQDPVGTLNANVLGTNNILKLGYQKKVKSILFFSSGEVYGEIESDKIPTKEIDYGYIDPTNVRSCYAESKRLGETMCVSWFKQFGVPVKIVRPFHTYGPGIELDDGRVFSDFSRDIINNRDIIMKSDGTARRAFCYITDATKGFFTVLLKGGNGEAYNVGNDTAEVSISELANMLVNLFPEKSLKVIREEGNIAASYIKSKVERSCPDIQKIGKLGGKPCISIHDGFKRTILSYNQ